MRWFLAIALILVALVPASARPSGGCQGRICVQARANLGCLRPPVRAILHRLAARVGPIEVTSTCRGRHVRNSLHYSGRAADLRALRVSQHVAVRALMGDRGVAHVIAEARGLVHVDIGRGSERPAYARLGRWSRLAGYRPITR